jgi:hypothetical protein
LKEENAKLRAPKIPPTGGPPGKSAIEKLKEEYDLLKSAGIGDEQIYKYWSIKYGEDAIKQIWQEITEK